MPVGVPGPELLTLAHTQDCQFIVIGSHGHSLAREIALGGVATDVIHRADLPVLVARMVIGEEAGIPQCRISAGAVCDHVLYATDFSDNAERAFGYVESLVQHGCHHVTVMHVQDRTRIAPQPGSAPRRVQYGRPCTSSASSNSASLNSVRHRWTWPCRYGHPSQENSRRCGAWARLPGRDRHAWSRVSQRSLRGGASPIMSCGCRRFPCCSFRRFDNDDGRYSTVNSSWMKGEYSYGSIS